MIAITVRHPAKILFPFERSESSTEKQGSRTDGALQAKEGRQ